MGTDWMFGFRKKRQNWLERNLHWSEEEGKPVLQTFLSYAALPYLLLHTGLSWGRRKMCRVNQHLPCLELGGW